MSRGASTDAIRPQSLQLHDFRPDLPHIGCLTLVLCGREDALTRLEMHEEMARLIPRARLAVIERCGHLSTLERPVEVNTALRNWLTPDP